MKYLTFSLLCLTTWATAQTVTILPTKSMVRSEREFISLGVEGKFAVLSPNEHGEEDLSVIEFHQAPGSKISLHLHYETDEYMHVQRGTLTVTIRDSTFTAEEGTFIHIPAGTPHSHANQKDTSVEVLLIYRPGSMVNLFRAWGRLVASGVEDRTMLRNRLLLLPEDYDVEFIE
jgi:quercetin dioxygenase-like cupin family protein